MNTHYQLSDADFARQFADLSLDPKLFSHEAHLRLAWILIKREGIEKAIEMVCKQIKAFDAHHGDGTVYHETLTTAAVHIVKHFMDKASLDDFSLMLEEFPRIKNNFKGLIEAHYSNNIFTDPFAKVTYQEPDLLPFI